MPSGHANAPEHRRDDPFEFDETDEPSPASKRARKRLGQPSVAPPAKVPRVSGVKGLANTASNEGHKRYSEPVTLPSVNLAACQHPHISRTLSTACPQPQTRNLRFCHALLSLSAARLGIATRAIRGTLTRLRHSPSGTCPTRCPKSVSSNQMCPLPVVMLIRRLLSLSISRPAIRN